VVELVVVVSLRAVPAAVVPARLSVVARVVVVLVVVLLIVAITIVVGEGAVVVGPTFHLLLMVLPRRAPSLPASFTSPMARARSKKAMMLTRSFMIL